MKLKFMEREVSEMLEVLFCIVLFVILLLCGVNFLASLLVVFLANFVVYKPVMLLIIYLIDRND